MPNIVYDVKLDFKDVLLRPKRSTLRSRAEVSAELTNPRLNMELHRSPKFIWSPCAQLYGTQWLIPRNRMEYRLPRNVEKMTSVNTLLLGKYPRPVGGGQEPRKVEWQAAPHRIDLRHIARSLLLKFLMIPGSYSTSTSLPNVAPEVSPLFFPPPSPPPPQTRRMGLGFYYFFDLPPDSPSCTP